MKTKGYKEKQRKVYDDDFFNTSMKPNSGTQTTPTNKQTGENTKQTGMVVYHSSFIMLL
jgi:hypothetical protein